MAALGHGIGVGCYAFFAVIGLAVIIEQSPELFNGLKLLGAAFLAYMGFRALEIKLAWPGKAYHRNNSSTRIQKNHPQHDSTTASSSFILGLLTAVLNPKVALFFLALFSQFVSGKAAVSEKIIMASTVLTVDTLWYLLVVVITSHRGVSALFSGYGKTLQRVFGLLLIILAARIAWT